MSPLHSYLVFDVDINPLPEFTGLQWDIRNINGYKSSYGSTLPNPITLTQLMEAVVK